MPTWIGIRRHIGGLAGTAILIAACSGGVQPSGAATAPSVGPPASGQPASGGATAATTITLQRFFGSCDEEFGTVTDLTKAVGECGVATVLINKFNAESTTGSKIDARAVAYEQYYDQLNSSFAASDPPDVFLIHRSRLPDYVSGNSAAPLDDILAAAGVDVNDFIPFAREGLTYDGKIYAEPFDMHALLWHVNVDLFKTAGLVDGSGKAILPKSPQELLDQAAKIKAATGKNYIAVETDGAMFVRVLTSWVAQQGSHLFDQAGKVTIDTPEALTALNLIKQLYDSGFADKTQTYQTAEQAFLAGDAAVVLNGTWVVNDYDAKAKAGSGGLKTYEVSSLPQLFKQPGGWADEHSWAASTRAANDPAKAAVIGEWLRFLHDNSVAWATTGHMSPFKSTLDSAAYKALPQRTGYASTGQIEADAIPPVKSYPSIETAIKEAINPVPQGADPAAALKQAQQEVEAIFAQ